MIETLAGIAVPQGAVPLRLFAWARGTATWLFAHPMAGIAALAAVFGAVEHHEADKWAGVARQRAATIASITSANSQAIQQATTAKEEQDAKNAKLAADGDRAAADLRGRYHAAVLQLAAAQGRARSADLPGRAASAQSRDRSGEGALVPAGPAALAISQDDALICADNTARLQAVHDWATALGE